MADEVIKIIEYIIGNPVVQGVTAAYVVISIVVALIALAIIVYIFRCITNMRNRRNRRRW